MVFVPKTWANDQAGNTPITAAELNRIEQGIVGGDNTALVVGGSSVFRLAAAENYTGTALASSAGLVTPVLPAGAYDVEVAGLYSGSTTGQGIRAAIFHSGTVSQFQAGMMAALSGTTANNSIAVVNGNPLGFSPTPVTTSLTTQLPFQITCSLLATTTGTIALRGASSTTGTITFAAGTCMRVTRIS